MVVIVVVVLVVMVVVVVVVEMMDDDDGDDDDGDWKRGCDASIFTGLRCWSIGIVMHSFDQQ